MERGAGAQGRFLLRLDGARSECSKTVLRPHSLTGWGTRIVALNALLAIPDTPSRLLRPLDALGFGPRYDSLCSRGKKRHPYGCLIIYGGA